MARATVLFCTIFVALAENAASLAPRGVELVHIVARPMRAAALFGMPVREASARPPAGFSTSSSTRRATGYATRSSARSHSCFSSTKRRFIPLPLDAIRRNGQRIDAQRLKAERSFTRAALAANIENDAFLTAHAAYADRLTRVDP